MNCRNGCQYKRPRKPDNKSLSPSRKKSKKQIRERLNEGGAKVKSVSQTIRQSVSVCCQFLLAIYTRTDGQQQPVAIVSNRDGN